LGEKGDGMSLDARTWADIDRVLTKCEGVSVPTDFCVTAAVVLRQVFPYDAGTVFFLGEDGRLSNVRLLGVSRALAREYVERYMGADEGAYSVERAARDVKLLESRLHGDPYRPAVLDWSREPHDTRFWREYVSRLRVRWSVGACLYDPQGRARVVLAFDRGERGHAPTPVELEALSVCNRHIDALYRNFYVEPPRDPGAGLTDLVTAPADARAGDAARLTPREKSVGYELVQGHSPKQVAQVLGVSRATVYKHMEHMHHKLGVNTQAALIQRLNLMFSRGDG
jgi:DNA-binding CsgD family transcriptional regulator